MLFRVAEDLGIFKREKRGREKKARGRPVHFPAFRLGKSSPPPPPPPACCPILSGSCRVNSGDSGRGRSEIDSRRESNS